MKKLQWNAGVLEAVWTFESDWKPEPLELAVWEAVFLPVLSGDSIYVPGLGGTVHKVSKTTEVASARINPFAGVDRTVYVAGGLAAGPDGSLLYNAIRPDPRWTRGRRWKGPGWSGSRRAEDPDGVDFATLVPGAPAATDLCRGPFRDGPAAMAALARRRAARVPVRRAEARDQRRRPRSLPTERSTRSAAPTHNNRYSYLVAVHPDLTPAWSASLRGILNDGCGVLLPRNDVLQACRSNAPFGVDPATNDRPAGRVSDAGTSSPVVLPDGAILIGTSTSYNFSRGHLFKFDSAGGALATYDFGWDITPAVFPHDGTYSILIKDNHYFDLAGNSFYDVTTLDANLVPEWSFRATNTESCVRQPDDTIVCVDDHPEGFEWCINQPAVDAAGILYLNGEDGVLYAFNRQGQVVGQIFLDTALGAAYTPIALGPDGVVYTQNNGHLFAIGRARYPRELAGPRAERSGSPRLVERP